MEKPISLSKAAQIYDKHLSTVHRWRLRGVNGIRLETWRIGGRRVTSRAALARFHARVTAAADGQPTPSTESNKAREQWRQRVEAQLAAEGI